jgi:glucose/arabinose dehydrogenase
VQASLDYKQRLQQLFFPEGIAFDGNRFNRTAATAPLFNYLAPSESADEKMVDQTGIEPDGVDRNRVNEGVESLQHQPRRVPGNCGDAMLGGSDGMQQHPDNRGPVGREVRTKTMIPSKLETRPARLWPFLFIGCLAGSALASVGGAQQNSVHPQPRAEELPGPAKATANPNRRVPQPEGTLPKVPAGFSVASYAELRGPRMMVYAPNGDLFVSSPSTNSIFVLREVNNDGVFEARGVYADGKTAAAPPPPAAADGRPAPVLGVLEGPQSLVPNPPACTPPPDYGRRGAGGVRLPFGLASHGDYVYVGNTDSIVRFEYRRGDLEARGAPEKLLDLPTGGHSTRNILFNRAGTKLYIAVGSASNSDAGEDCRRAAILEANPDGTGARIYASGIRNPVGLALQPGTDVVWAATNERDNLGDDLVPDYATSVKDGGFYGWPYSYIGRHYDPKHVGAFPELVGRALVPDVLLPAHSAALGITF